MKTIIIFLSLFLISLIAFAGDVEIYTDESGMTHFIGKQKSRKVFESNSEEATYFNKAKELYIELQNKYQWAKSNNISPKTEAHSLESHMPSVLAGKGEEYEEAFQKLPWGGWSNQWGQKLKQLTNEVEEFVTPTPIESKFKRELLIALKTMYFLRGDYEDLLDNKNKWDDMEFRKTEINECFEKCEDVLLQMNENVIRSKKIE